MYPCSIPNDNIPDYIKRIRSLKFHLGMISDEELAVGNSEKEKLNSREELLGILVGINTIQYSS